MARSCLEKERKEREKAREIRMEREKGKRVKVGGGIRKERARARVFKS